MAKQCPECYTVSGDDLGYCDACGCELTGRGVHASVWQYLAIAVAVAAGFAVTALFMFKN